MNQGHNYSYTTICILIVIYTNILFIIIELYFIHYPAAQKILNIIYFIQWTKVISIALAITLFSFFFF